MIGLFILFSLTSYAETKKLEEIGRYTLVRIKGEVPVAEVMKILVDKYAGDIKYGFDLVGAGDLYFPFIEQIKVASFEEKTLPVGDTLMWMLFRSHGKIKALQDIEWAGKAPLPVFSFTVVKGYNHYEFVMPKPCGNIALRKVEEVIPDAICAIKVAPDKANLNDPISVDMGGTKEAQSMQVEVFDKAGNKVASQKLTPDSPKWQTKFDKPGEYVFKGKAFNVKGKPSENPCEAMTYINAPPLSKVESSAREGYVGLPVTFNAGGSSDPDGDVVKVDYEVADESGNLVDRYSTTQKPFTWEKTFDNAGTFTVTAIATDDFGAMSEPARIEVLQKYKRTFFLVEAGPMLVLGRGSSAFGLEGQLGFVYALKPNKLEILVTAGGGLPFSGDPWQAFFITNALLNYYAGQKFYVGIGPGFSTKVRNDVNAKAEVVTNIGYDIFNKIKSKASIFVEGRFLGTGSIVAGFRLLL